MNTRQRPVSIEGLFIAYLLYITLGYSTSAKHLSFSDTQLRFFYILRGTFFCTDTVTLFFSRPLELSDSICSLFIDLYLKFMVVCCGNNENSNAVMRSAAGSRGVDENNEDYPSKEVRSNNVLNLALPRKRLPKVTSH